MNQFIPSIKTYTSAHKKQLAVGAIIISGIIILICIIVFFVRSNAPKIVYQPANACDMLTFEEAEDLLGAKTLNSNTNPPVISSNTATSRCGYTDGNPDTNNMIVAAVIVRSGINNKGVQQNVTEFTLGKPGENAKSVKDLGDDAYFNQALGQLNILNGRDWIILSYGIGSAPETNTIDKAIELARKITPTFLTSKF